MKDRLIRDSILKFTNKEQRDALRAEARRLQGEGHAVACEDTFVDGVLTSTTAHHYLTCEACTRATKQREK